MVASMAARSDPEFCIQARYATLEPRGPTYPEVPELCATFGDRDYRRHIGRGNDELIPRPISLVLHVPGDPGSSERFTEQLLREIALLAPLFDRDRDVAELRWTGASDRLDEKLNERVLDSIKRHFHVTAAATVVCQVIFGSVRQSPDSLRHALQTAGKTCPDSIDLVDGALLWPRESAFPVMDGRQRLALLEHGVRQLQDMGYSHSYKDRFVLAGSGDRSFEFDQVGIGPGAISFTGGGVCQNAPCLGDWESLLNLQRLPVARGRSLTRTERRRAELLGVLLRGGNVELEAIEQCFAAVPDCLEKLRRLEACGLLTKEGERLAASSRGRYLWRILAQCFDPGFKQSERAVHGGGPDVEGRQRGRPA